MICIMLMINGAALFLPMLFTSGNKDSRHLSALDGWLFGAGAGIGMIPGLSRMALVYSAATIRGVDRQSAFRYGILLGIPSLAGYVATDLLALTAAGSGAVTVSVLLNICLLFITSVFGTYLSISMLKNLTARRSLSDFCYYCWGSALLALILHLSVS
jgi:undecaprenyl pyrophosphate phosphatase UppP